MKVKVELTFDIDTDAWAANYGFDPEETALMRYDVKNYCEGILIEQLQTVGVLKEGS